jgi:Flp pilus assembly protein TadD
MKTVKPKVFISATSGDLGPIRTRIKEALLTLGCDPIVQDNFPPDHRSVEELLRKRIAECDAVVHIAGFRYGQEPRQRDKDEPRRSYTQMEYHTAKKLNKPIYTFICGQGFPFAACEPEDEEKRRLQLAHRDLLLGGPSLYQEIRETAELDRKVREIDYWEALRRRLRKAFWAQVGVTAAATLAAAGIGVLAVRTLVGVEPDLEKGERLFRAKDYAGAFHALSKASDAAPGKVDLHRKIEDCARRGKLANAFLERYRSLVKQNPQSAIVHNYLGNAYLLLDPEDKDGEGAKHYQAALQLDPNFAPPLVNLGILASRHGNFEKAEPLLLRYLQAEPSDALGWMNLGILYLQRAAKSPEEKAEMLGKAEQLLNKAMSRDPASAGVWKQLGRVYEETSRTNDALNAYQKSLALDYEQPEVRQRFELLAWGLERSGISAGGKDDFTTRSFSSSGGSQTNLVAAMRAIATGKTSDAKATLQRLVTQEPENPLAYRLMGKVYEAEGESLEATNAFAQATRLASRVTESPKP